MRPQALPSQYDLILVRSELEEEEQVMNQTIYQVSIPKKLTSSRSTHSSENLLNSGIDKETPLVILSPKADNENPDMAIMIGYKI